LTLAAEDPGSDVALWINSPGGSVPSMLAIRDVMRLVPCDVSTLALGLACSAGQFLLSAGTKGKRFALPHARILMHRGSAGIGGSAVDIEVQADDLRHTVDTVLGPGVANTLIAQLLHLEADSAEQEINLYINCEGGDLPSMLAVYDTMQYIEAPVATTCVGQAIGVGAVLLAAGTPGRRALLPH